MRSFFKALTSPFLPVAPLPLPATRHPPPETLLRVLMYTGEREGERVTGMMIAPDEEDDRFAYNLHAMCLVCLAGWWWLSLSVGFSHTGRVESSQAISQEAEAMTTFGSGIYWHCNCVWRNFPHQGLLD